jgi:hypothetical protein
MMGKGTEANILDNFNLS